MLTIFKSINPRIFFKAATILAIIYVVSFFFAFARSEGAEGIVFPLMSVPAIIISIPFFWLCAEVKFLQNPAFFIIAIILDILIYSLLIERIFTFYHKWRVDKIKDFKTKKYEQ